MKCNFHVFIVTLAALFKITSKIYKAAKKKPIIITLVV